MADDVLQLLLNYSWPGNVRELENMMERMAYMASDTGLINMAEVPIIF